MKCYKIIIAWQNLNPFFLSLQLISKLSRFCFSVQQILSSSDLSSYWFEIFSEGALLGILKIVSVRKSGTIYSNSERSEQFLKQKT